MLACGCTSITAWQRAVMWIDRWWSRQVQNQKYGWPFKSELRLATSDCLYCKPLLMELLLKNPNKDIFNNYGIMVPWLILKLSKSRSGADFQKWPKQSPDHCAKIFSSSDYFSAKLTVLLFRMVCCGASTWSRLARTGVSRISDS